MKVVHGPDGAAEVAGVRRRRRRRLGHHRHERLRTDPRGGQGRPPRGPGQQGIHGRRRGPAPARSGPLGGPDHPRRQRAQRRLPVPGQGKAAERPQGHPDRLGRPLPEDPPRGPQDEDARGGPPPPPLGHGPEGDRRFGDADEQGARAHRGPLAFRPGRLGARRPHPSPERRSCPRRDEGRLGPGPAQRRRTCACPSSTP